MEFLHDLYLLASQLLTLNDLFDLLLDIQDFSVSLSYLSSHHTEHLELFLSEQSLLLALDSLRLEKLTCSVSLSYSHQHFRQTVCHIMT